MTDQLRDFIEFIRQNPGWKMTLYVTSKKNVHDELRQALEEVGATITEVKGG